MAKISKRALQALDAAIDHLGGGAPPIPRRKRTRQVTAPRKVAKAKAPAKKR